MSIENKKELFINDFKSGLIVALVALPLCLGISLASGAPLISGVIGGIIGGIVIGFLSNSHVSVSGPAAGLAVTVFGAIKDLGNFEIFLCAVVVAGCVQLLMGFLKLGGFAKLLPHSVIEGMLASIGILIVMKQIPYVLGIVKFQGYKELFTNFPNAGMFMGPLAIGTICLSLYIIYNTTSLKTAKIFKTIPFSLMLVILASVLAVTIPLPILEEHFVDLGHLESGSFWEVFKHPDFTYILRYDVLKYGFIIALVASIETLLCVGASDKLDPEKRITDTNRELKAQGLGNVISGLMGGIPLTSVIVRTSVNINAGAKSKFSAIIHGFLLLISIELFPSLLTKIPLTVLAVILVVAGYNLANPKLFKKMILHGYKDFIPFFATIIGIVSNDLLIGVVIGAVVAAIIHFATKK